VRECFRQELCDTEPLVAQLRDVLDRQRSLLSIRDSLSSELQISSLFFIGCQHNLLWDPVLAIFDMFIRLYGVRHMLAQCQNDSYDHREVTYALSIGAKINDPERPLCTLLHKTRVFCSPPRKFE